MTPLGCITCIAGSLHWSDKSDLMTIKIAKNKYNPIIVDTWSLHRFMAASEKARYSQLIVLVNV